MFAEPDLNTSECSYSCRPDGGCRVQYVGASRSGPSAGSCYPPWAGGSCRGNPPECLHCNLALDCNKQGEWESWGPWGHCSKTCGRGTKTRTRYCTNPLYGGKNCVGEKMDRVFCDTRMNCKGKQIHIT